MTKFKNNITKSIDNLNILQHDLELVYGDELETNIDNMLINNIDTKSGSNLTYNNTVDSGKLDFDIIGNCEQDSYNGKNKFGTNYLQTVSNISIINANTNDFSYKNMWVGNLVDNTNVLNILKTNTQYTVKAKFKIISRPENLGSNNVNRLLALFDGTNVISVLNSSIKNSGALNTLFETAATTFTTPASLTNFRIIGYNFKDDNNNTAGEIEIVELQIEEGPSATNFEKFVRWNTSTKP